MATISLGDRPQPYVGVSGISTPEQAQAILDMWPEGAPPQSLMLGVLTSQKVLDGGERNARSPAPSEIHGIWPSDARAVNLVHYFTKDPATIRPHVFFATGSPRCHGVQINVAWPPPESIADLCRDAPELSRVVLQIGPRMLAEYFPAAIAERISRDYHGLVTDVLIDVSAGMGVPIESKRAHGIVALVRAWNPDIGIGIAGGLCAETLPAVAELVRQHGLSIDAEGRLRNDRDELDLDKVRAYLTAAAWMWGWA